MAKGELLDDQPRTRLGERLLAELSDPSWTELRGAVAYAKLSGVEAIAGPLHSFAQRAPVLLTVGIDQQGTSIEALLMLWQVLQGGVRSELFVLHNPGGNPSPTFHPKIWLFSNEQQSVALIGSGNLTRGGLFGNYEAGAALRLDSTDRDDRAFLASLRQTFTRWSRAGEPHIIQVDPSSLQQMHDAGELPTEASQRTAAGIHRTALTRLSGKAGGENAISRLFRPAPIADHPTNPPIPSLPPAPVTIRPTARISSSALSGPVSSAARRTDESVMPQTLVPIHNQLIIEVRPRRKTELYLAKQVLKDDPAFFGWPFLGLTTPTKTKNVPQPQPDPLPSAFVTVYDASGVVAKQVFDRSLKMWTYSNGPSANDDFRLTLTGGLHHLVVDDSIMVMTRQPTGISADYQIDIYPPGHPEYNTLRTACTGKLGRSGGGVKPRVYGWK